MNPFLRKYIIGPINMRKESIVFLFRRWKECHFYRSQFDNCGRKTAPGGARMAELVADFAPKQQFLSTKMCFTISSNVNLRSMVFIYIVRLDSGNSAEDTSSLRINGGSPWPLCTSPCYLAC